MGDPKKQKKKYSKPSHPWQKGRIEEEIGLLKEYGLKNKKEIWKMRSMLKKFSRQAKKLIISTGPQADLEKKQLITKLISFGLIEDNARLEDILTITLKDIMERRLQTLVYKKNLAISIKQARQFIVHRHITVDDKLITFPSYLVVKTEEDKINFLPSSSLSNPDHAERAQQLKEKKKIRKKKAK